MLCKVETRNIGGAIAQSSGGAPGAFVKIPRKFLQKSAGRSLVRTQLASPMFHGLGKVLCSQIYRGVTQLAELPV